MTTITAQIHDDEWYYDTNGQSDSGAGGGRQGGQGIGLPRPLIGTELDANGDIQFGVEESAITGSDGSVESLLTVSFFSPAVSAGAGPGIPLVSLAANVAAGGTLQGGQTLYYAVAGTDESGNESPLSFVVRAVIVSSGRSVTLKGLSFAPGTVGFHVYRGNTPSHLFRIASDEELAGHFTDTGLDKQLAGPPDPNFDHANFYWRMEMQPEQAGTIHSSTTVGNAALNMAPNRYRGMIARITRGKGAGQERSIAANSATTLTVAPAWEVAPDATSFFVVAENGWRFGALATTSPVQFSVVNRSGETVHLSGRSANANNVECAPEISIVTRWMLGGGGESDSDVPPPPFFGLGASPGGGSIELSGVSFSELENTHSISSATLTLHYWDELLGTPETVLASGITDTDMVLDLNVAGSAEVGGMIQVGSEVMRVEQILNNGTRYEVTRGINDSGAVAHDAAAIVYPLLNKTVIAPFPPNFFGSPYSGSWTFPIPLPDVRVAAAEMFVTNHLGNSASREISLTHNDDVGIRTLSGGQYSIQISGFLAVDESAAPPLLVESSHSVRDVYAVLGTEANSEVQIRLNVDDVPYCTLTFMGGVKVSDSADGNALPPLMTGSHVTLSVLSVGSTYPGVDLTVLIRL